MTHGSPASTRTAEDSLLVTWQNPESREYYLMGVLQHSPEKDYTFTYYPDVAERDGVRLIPGFPEVGHTYTSPVLFPLFSSRLMSPKRTDRDQWLASHGLRADAAPLQILGRSLGRRVGDQFELYPEPLVNHASKTVTAQLPLHGLRYHPEGDAAVRRGAVRGGEAVHIVPEPDNEHDSHAQAVSLVDGTQLGYIPRPALDYLHRTGGGQGVAEGRVAHVNPDQYGHHERLILDVLWRL